jgi:hypothetical protein
MLALDPASIEQWLLAQPGGWHALEPGLGEDALPSVLLALERLAERLEAVRAGDPERLSACLLDSSVQATFRRLARHLSTGRRLRLLSWVVESALPHAGQIVAALFDPGAPPAGSGASLYAAVERQHRMALIETIFAPERRTRVQAACRRGGLA